ncbi:hypothetical protein AB0G20_01370 [Streptomyces sp. NPDC024017]
MATQVDAGRRGGARDGADQSRVEDAAEQREGPAEAAAEQRGAPRA